jgi:TPR repeat protein
MKKYYLTAIKNNEKIYNMLLLKKSKIPINFYSNINYILLNLGLYYEKIEKDYKLAKQYYLTAVEKGNSNAMYNLGYYNRNIEKDYDLMKKYYLMAIEKGNSNAMNNLGNYYEKTEKNTELMKKYYLMAIRKGNSIAIKYCVNKVL